MKFKRLIRLASLFTLFLTQPAWAVHLGFKGVDIEPYLGYGLLGSIGASGQESSTYSGVAGGLRAVAEFKDYFFVGPDFLYLPIINYYLPQTTTSITPKPHILKLGIVTGVALPAHLSFWIGVNFIDHLSLSETVSTLTVVNTYSGFSLKIGAAYNPLPFLSLRAELIHTVYNYINETETISNTGGGGTQSTSEVGSLSGSQTLTGQVLLLSVSSPINILFWPRLQK